jgi:hypothetical protein
MLVSRKSRIGSSGNRAIINRSSFLCLVFQMDQLQIGEETPTAAYPKEQTRIANSQEHSAVNRPQIEKTAVTLDNPASTETEELRELPITAGDGRLLSAPHISPEPSANSQCGEYPSIRA